MRGCCSTSRSEGAAAGSGAVGWTAARIGIQLGQFQQDSLERGRRRPEQVVGQQQAAGSHQDHAAAAQVEAEVADAGEAAQPGAVPARRERFGREFADQLHQPADGQERQQAAQHAQPHRRVIAVDVPADQVYDKAGGRAGDRGREQSR